MISSVVSLLLGSFSLLLKQSVNYNIINDVIRGYPEPKC